MSTEPRSGHNETVELAAAAILKAISEYRDELHKQYHLHLARTAIPIVWQAAGIVEELDNRPALLAYVAHEIRHMLGRYEARRDGSYSAYIARTAVAATNEGEKDGLK